MPNTVNLGMPVYHMCLSILHIGVTELAKFYVSSWQMVHLPKIIHFWFLKELSINQFHITMQILMHFAGTYHQAQKILIDCHLHYSKENSNILTNNHYSFFGWSLFSWLYHIYQNCKHSKNRNKILGKLRT